MYKFKRVLTNGKNQVLLNGVDISGNCAGYSLEESAEGLELTLKLLCNEVEMDVETGNVTFQLK